MGTLRPIRTDCSLWPKTPDYFAAPAAKIHSLSQRHCTASGLNLMISIFSQILQNLNDNGVVGDRISAEVPPYYWQYPASCTGSHTEATLTSDMIHFDCFVFQSSNSTLHNINTADMAYKLIWPYLIKMVLWFYPSHCPIPSRLTWSEGLQP